MRKMLFFAAAMIIVSVLFLDMAKCEEKKQSGQAPERMSVLDRIKKSYNDFRNRGQVKKASVPVPAPIAKKEEKKKPATKEELLQDIKDDLKTQEEILEAMPSLKAEKDSEGKVFYAFNGVKIDDMSKEELEQLFSKVGQLAVKFRTERIQRQLDTVRQANQGGPGRVPVAAPSAPQSLRAPTLPAPPRASAPPPAPPRASAPPPAPPSRR
ncbi:MAG: hypothetical protein Q8R38_01170 [Candidatus Omnitrophota bacterium]|nr:hypothetical protein [Candidatus Omnitrophota bacterium]